MTHLTELPPQATPPPPAPPGRRLSRRDIWLIVLVVVGVVAVVAAVALVALTRDNQPAQPGQTGAAPSSVAPTSAGASAPSSAGPSASASASATAAEPVPFGYQALWPFSSPADARAWQEGYRSGGHQPWHLDADQTALSFTTGYLGFAEVNVVVWHSITGNEALVAVGYPIEGHAPGTAAVLHLAKYGTGADAPWEVVGSKDTTLTLTTPAYGATVSSPMAVGGRITGVDENIRVQVRQPSTSAPLGDAPGVPAGGQDTPWSTTVSFHDATAPALTVVAWTGGHYTGVERFAVTGVRT